MAEPLTSTDIWRIQRGFGVSDLSNPEEQKRFASAGVAPLTSGARRRFEEGKGISPMASQAEKDAWVASEVMAGTRPQTDLPKAFGGLGERPSATTRRGFRMQQEWDAQYKLMMDQQQAQREAEKAASEEAIRKRDQFLQENEFYYNRGIKEADQKLKAAQLSQATSIIGALNQLDLRDPDYRKKVGDVFVNNPLGVSDPNVINIADQYGSANELYMSSIASQSEQQRKSQEDRQKAINDFLAAGGNKEEILKSTKPDPITGIAFVDINELNEKTAMIKGAGIKAEKEKEAKQPQLKEEEASASSARSLINTFEQESVKVGAEIARLQKLAEGGDKVSSDALPAKLAEKAVYDSKIEELKTSVAKPLEGKPSSGYIIGKTYQGMTYLGGDPTQSENWKKK